MITLKCLFKQNKKSLDLFLEDPLYIQTNLRDIQDVDATTWKLSSRIATRISDGFKISDNKANYL